MTDVLVIGFGSELRRDDAVGCRVAEAVERCAIPGVRVLTTTQLVPELVETIAAASAVVFVDASVERRTVSVERVAPGTGASPSHHATPAQLLALAGSVGLACPPARLVHVPAHDLSLGEGLSDPAAAAVERAVELTGMLVRRLAGDGHTAHSR